MPAPDKPHVALISKRGVKTKHIAVTDRRMHDIPFRPLCNAHSDDDRIVFVNRQGAPYTANEWFVDLNPNAWSGRSLCKNCIKVTEELFQLIHGLDVDSEREPVEPGSEGGAARLTSNVITKH